MPNTHDAHNWLLDGFTTQFASVMETMTGERLSIECRPSGAVPSGGLLWRQPFVGVPGTMWVSAAEADVAAIGGHILTAADVAGSDRETIHSTYFEMLGQVVAGVAQALSNRLGREITPDRGVETSEILGSTLWSRVEVRLAQGAAVIKIGFDDVLLGNLAPTVPEADSPIAGAPLTSKTFDLLLDVELPVSISFGRAQVQLKDVLKLTTGSIVELNRSISEPVEVVVNNCVIARGEVVVVEGNFGVRIQQVISRQERLRTLH